jgi:putative endonuclease
MNTHEKGRTGEDLAADYLLSKGYAIEARNFRNRYGELDIVATAPDGTLVFVEVKAAGSSGCGNPLYRVTPAKQRKVAGMAKRYMYDRKLIGRPCRLDVIGVYRGKIDHIPNAFWA